MYMSILILTNVDEGNLFAIKICEKCGRSIRKYDKCDCEFVDLATPRSSPPRNYSRNSA